MWLWAFPKQIESTEHHRQSIPGIPRNTVNALKHHLIPALLPFEEANFNVSEQEFNDWQVNDLFVNNFIHQISKLHEHVMKRDQVVSCVNLNWYKLYVVMGPLRW